MLPVTLETTDGVNGEDEGGGARAKGFVPVAAGMSGCAAGCCCWEKLGGENGELEVDGDPWAGLPDFAKGFVLCLLTPVGTEDIEPNELLDAPVGALETIDCRNGFDETGDSIVEPVAKACCGCCWKGATLDCGMLARPGWKRLFCCCGCGVYPPNPAPVKVVWTCCGCACCCVFCGCICCCCCCACKNGFPPG